MLDAFLNHVASKFVLREIGYLRYDQVDQLGAIFHSAMLDDVLSHVIAILVEDERRCRSMDLLKHRCLGMLFTVLQHTLNNPAAILISRQTVDLASERIEDKLNVLGRYPLNRFLHDMIAILVSDTFQHIMLQLFDQLGLLVGKDMFECLKQSTKSSS